MVIDKIKKYTILLLSVGVSNLFATTPCHVNKEGIVFVKTFLSVRDTPNGEELDKLYNGDKVYICNAKYSDSVSSEVIYPWYEIYYGRNCSSTVNLDNCKSGWVYSKYVDVKSKVFTERGNMHPVIEKHKQDRCINKYLGLPTYVHHRGQNRYQPDDEHHANEINTKNINIIDNNLAY